MGSRAQHTGRQVQHTGSRIEYTGSLERAKESQSQPFLRDLRRTCAVDTLRP